MELHDARHKLLQWEIEEKVRAKLDSKNESLAFISRFAGKSVEARDRDLRAFPHEFIVDRDIVRVNLNTNLISYIPVAVCALSSLPSRENLQFLNLGSNRISCLPSEFRQLRLRELVLTKNHFRDVPFGSLNCASLELLHIEQNLFTRLSRDVLAFRNLLDLRLGWLQFCNPPVQEAMRYAGENSCYELSVLRVFEDFKQDNAYPRDVSCVALLQKYSFADPYLHLDAKGNRQ